MIYDKNQFIFNIILSVLLVVMIVTSIFYGNSLFRIKNQIKSINENLSEIEKNQNYINFIQGSHHNIEYQLTPEGFFISGANDFCIIKGASMQPALFEGNILIQEKYKNQNLTIGTIVRYIDNEGTPVIHRIRGVYNSTVNVQGDNLEEGEIINIDKITHVVIGVLFT